MGGLSDEYYEKHEVCPKCFSDYIEMTTKGIIIGDVDDNRATCECGWTGIVNDLVPKSS